MAVGLGVDGVVVALLAVGVLLELPLAFVVGELLAFLLHSVFDATMAEVG